MLSSIRKFSSSIYSKIFLVIVAIPFIFWGMGPVFQTGKLNTIAEIGKEKKCGKHGKNWEIRILKILIKCMWII